MLACIFNMMEENKFIMKKLLFVIGTAAVVTLSSCSVFVSTKKHSAGGHIGTIENPVPVVPHGPHALK